MMKDLEIEIPGDEVDSPKSQLKLVFGVDAKSLVQRFQELDT